MSEKKPKRILHLLLGEARKDLSAIVAEMGRDYEYVVLTVRGVPRAALIPNDELWNNIDLSDSNRIEVKRGQEPPQIIPISQE